MQSSPSPAPAASATSRASWAVLLLSSHKHRPMQEIERFSEAVIQVLA